MGIRGVVKESGTLCLTMSDDTLWLTFKSSAFVIAFELEWRFYALSASKANFRARTYSHNLFSPVMMIT